MQNACIILITPQSDSSMKPFVVGQHRRQSCIKSKGVSLDLMMVIPLRVSLDIVQPYIMAGAPHQHSTSEGRCTHKAGFNASNPRMESVKSHDVSPS